MSKKIIITPKATYPEIEKSLSHALENDDSIETFDTPCEHCPKCSSDNIANEDDASEGTLTVTCHDCSFQWNEPELSNLN